MQTIKEGVESLSLLAYLNMDRFLVLFATGSGLFVASYLVSL
ncbi:hypothetical protein AIOL_002257 [Candidatus Rhodobacter oscarellae]|uniref:Uncharacterized protein n=1 Tax=Candidatus Rhodobacter oscarellae TaxID=1675527 RepID=A0A0J9E3A4_9RHOB|nr:hypothetical protein [Candidatus Rhodobacter lobularis]KMW57296.1 hypothetical protein AIOL_002257 [Candidatus Rhodobacter lobularis]